jgi:membrane associated rhomboid family serine protease
MDVIRVPQEIGGPELHVSPRHASEVTSEQGDEVPPNATFLVPSDIHPNMIDREEDIARLRLLAGKLSADWRGDNFMAPALARRLRDFQFAQEKRRRKYGDERPWGILGLYDHLAAIRVDVEWAEDAAWRRANGEPYLSWTDFDNSKKRGINRPFFTYFILFVCTVILIASIAVNGWRVEPLGVNPMIGPSPQVLLKMGAKESDLIVNHNESWRLVSSMVLHAGLVHYCINMLALWFVGTAIECTHGFFAAAILFVIPAIGGTILSAIFLPEYITVGASGGIFGLIGACLSDIIMNWKLLFSDFVNENATKHKHAMVVVFLLLDIALNCIIGLTPYVDNFTRKFWLRPGQTNRSVPVVNHISSILQIWEGCAWDFCAVFRQWNAYLMISLE